MPKVGDTVYADFSTCGIIFAEQGVVTKVTPKGRFTVNFGKRGIRKFHESGWEMGGGYLPAMLLPDVAAYEALKARQMAQELLSEYIGQSRDCPRLKNIKNKAQILEHLAALTELAAQVPDDWEG